MKNIAIYSDIMQSGKSTIAKFLVDQYGYKRLSLADAIKNMLVVLVSYYRDNPQDYLFGNRKEEIIGELGVNGRYLMQTIGDEWGRQLVNDDIWLNIILKQVHYGGLYVVDDIRYRNEFEAFKKAGFIMLKIKGNGELTRDHSSEGNLTSFKFDHVIENNSTLADLYYKIATILGNF